jgi:signal transduction histidine kinase
MDEKDLREYLEIFAHKMRNPLHALMINLDVAKVKGEKSDIDPAIMKHLKIATDEVQRLNHIMERFFEYLKLPEKERKKKDLKQFINK